MGNRLPDCCDGLEDMKRCIFCDKRYLHYLYCSNNNFIVKFILVSDLYLAIKGPFGFFNIFLRYFNSFKNSFKRDEIFLRRGKFFKNRKFQIYQFFFNRLYLVEDIVVIFYCGLFHCFSIYPERICLCIKHTIA